MEKKPSRLEAFFEITGLAIAGLIKVFSYLIAVTVGIGTYIGLVAWATAYAGPIGLLIAFFLAPAPAGVAALIAFFLWLPAAIIALFLYSKYG
jgi:hypothetical protein